MDIMELQAQLNERTKELDKTKTIINQFKNMFVKSIEEMKNFTEETKFMTIEMFKQFSYIIVSVGIHCTKRANLNMNKHAEETQKFQKKIADKEEQIKYSHNRTVELEKDINKEKKTVYELKTQLAQCQYQIKHAQNRMLSDID